MARTIIAVFESVYSAKEAVWELVDLGFPRKLVEMVAENSEGISNGLARPEKPRSEMVLDDIHAGGIIGAGIGGSLGIFGALLIGRGAMQIAPSLMAVGSWVDGLMGLANGKMASIAGPQITPTLAAITRGPLAAPLMAAVFILAVTLFFAFAGSMAGGLVGLGIPEDEIRQYAKNVNVSTVTVMIVADGDAIDGSLKVLSRHAPLEIRQKTIEWQKAGPQEKKLAERALRVKVTEQNRPR